MSLRYVPPEDLQFASPDEIRQATRSLAAASPRRSGLPLDVTRLGNRLAGANPLIKSGKLSPEAEAFLNPHLLLGTAAASGALAFLLYINLFTLQRTLQTGPILEGAGVLILGALSLALGFYAVIGASILQVITTQRHNSIVLLGTLGLIAAVVFPPIDSVVRAGIPDRDRQGCTTNLTALHDLMDRYERETGTPLLYAGEDTLRPVWERYREHAASAFFCPECESTRRLLGSGRDLSEADYEDISYHGAPSPRSPASTLSNPAARHAPSANPLAGAHVQGDRASTGARNEPGELLADGYRTHHAPRVWEKTPNHTKNVIQVYFDELGPRRIHIDDVEGMVKRVREALSRDQLADEASEHR